jgi:branched-chain amino acid transport system substrate-binding protein
VYDLSNRDYTEEFYKNFKSEFENMGGEIVHSETFTSGIDVKFVDIADALLEPAPSGVLIVANAFDTAMICQHIRKISSKIPIIICAWAVTADLIQHGGAAVEGIISSQMFYRDSQNREFLEFKNRFRTRFGQDPNFAATYGYEAAVILFEALSKNDDPKTLKEHIIKQGVFQGLQGEITIDQYGDARRKNYLIIVKDGQFITIE